MGYFEHIKPRKSLSSHRSGETHEKSDFFTGFWKGSSKVIDIIEWWSRNEVVVR